MGKRKAARAGRVWKLLGLALLWAKKGGVRSLRAPPPRGSDVVARYAGEKEFSFDETPLFRFKLRRPTSVRTLGIPCINPAVVDFEEDDDDSFFRRDGRVSDDADREEDGGEERADVKVRGSAGGEILSEVGGEEECIDVKAEEFIARFYEQARLQRQVSILQYDEMLLRSTR